jgi:hypothetical protein
MRKRNSEKRNSEKEKAKKTGKREMGQAHDQPGRKHPERRNARKQSNGLGPVTIEGCAARSLYRSGWSIGAPVMSRPLRERVTPAWQQSPNGPRQFGSIDMFFLFFSV